MKLDVLKEFLRFWVAFSVVDEEGVGRVNAADLKVIITQHVRFFIVLPEILRVEKRRFTSNAHTDLFLLSLEKLSDSPKRPQERPCLGCG